MRVDDANIDLHGWLRSFYACGSLGRSFVMDNSVIRPIPSYADFIYNRSNYAAILKEVLQPLGLKLVQGKVMDAIVLLPSRDEVVFVPPSAAPPSAPPLRGGGGGAAVPSSSDSSEAVLTWAFGPIDKPDSVVARVAVPVVRRLRAKAIGLLKSSARRLGFSYSQLLGKVSVDGSSQAWRASYSVNQLWDIAVIASDSLGSLDFARIVDFSAGDTARVVFGGEIRRPESEIDYSDGKSVTKYASIFDGLTVDVSKDRWFFLWRRDGNILEVPGALGSCASGSNNIKHESRQGVPFLDKIPGLRWLFSWENKVSDELSIVVCLEELKDDLP